MKKLFSLILLSLCLTGCGETTISYKASRSSSPDYYTPDGSINLDHPSAYVVNDYFADYNVPFFADVLRDTGYYYPGGHSTNIPAFYNRDVKMVAPEAIMTNSDGSQTGLTIYSVIDEKGMENNYVFDGSRVIIGPGGTLLQAGLWDYDENGVPDVFTLSYSSPGSGLYQLGYVDLTAYYSVTFCVFRPETVEQRGYSFHFDSKGFYVNDSKLVYVAGRFSIPGVFEFTDQNVLI